MDPTVGQSSQPHCCGRQTLYMRKRPQDAKAIHVMSSGLKAGATWSRVDILQVRAFVSGHGVWVYLGRLVLVALPMLCATRLMPR